MNEPLVSVIMPVYGVENYVGRAIESILNQSYKNFEFFCVDDGSPDKSGEICDEYAKKDSRIKVIHKENGGAPSARNTAIDKATGRYMYFLDSDDWAEANMLSDMVELAEKNSSQLVVSGYYIDTFYSDTEKFTQEQKWISKVFSSQREFRENAHLLFDLNLLYTPWNKLFSGDYIRENKLYFPNTFWDDFPFNLSVIRDVERVAVTDKKYYHFIRQRAESETAKYRSDMYSKREEENVWLKDLYSYWGVENDGVREFLARRYVERLIGCIENVTNKNCNLKAGEKRKEIKKMISASTARAYLKQAKPRSSYMKIMLIPIRMKSATLTYLEGRVISSVKQSNTKLFARLKAGR